MLNRSVTKKEMEAVEGFATESGRNIAEREKITRKINTTNGREGKTQSRNR